MNVFDAQYEALQLLIDEGHPDKLEADVLVRLGAQPFSKADAGAQIDARRDLFVNFLERPAGRYAKPISAPVLVSLVFTGNPEGFSIEDRRVPGWEFRLHALNRQDLIRVAGVLSARLDRTNEVWFPTAEEYESGLHALTLALRPG